MHQIKMPLKEKYWIKTKQPLEILIKLKLMFYELCEVNKHFNYEKSYAEFSVSSKKEVGSNFPA